MGVASEKNLKIDSGLVNLRNKDGVDINLHKFSKRASVNFTNDISKASDKQKEALKLNESLENDSILVENKGVVI